MRRSAIVFAPALLILLGNALYPSTALGLPTGSIVGWGSQVVVEPSVLEDLVAIVGGGLHSLGLKADGTIVAWGSNEVGQCSIPPPNADFVAVAGGFYHGLGLKSDGTIVAWGGNGDGQCSVPAPNADFVVIGVDPLLRTGDFSCLGNLL